MKPIFRVLLALMAISLWVNGCGKGANANKQPSGKVEAPDYPSDQNSVLALNTGISSASYSGTVLVINEASDPKRLGAVINASTKVREAWAAEYRFREVNRYAERNTEMEKEAVSYDKNISDIEDEIKEFKRLARKRNLKKGRKEGQEKDQEEDQEEFIDEWKKYLEPWFIDRLERAYRGNDQGLKEAKELFYGYCEAKVWELAVNPYFANRRYLTVPSPLGFCDGYYRENGFFDPAKEECKPSETLEGKSFFPCLWKYGVLATRWFNGNHEAYQENAYAKKVKVALTNIFRNEDFSEKLRKLLTMEYSNDLYFIPRINPEKTERVITKKYLIDEDGNFKNTYTSYFLNGKKQLGASKRFHENIKEPDDFKNLWEEGIYKYPRDRESNNFFTPQKYISTVESANEKNFKTLLLADGSELNLAEVLQLFAKRMVLKHSVNDYYLHELEGRGRLKKVKEIPSIEIKEETITKIEQELEGIYGRLSDEDKAQINQYEEKKAEYESKKDQLSKDKEEMEKAVKPWEAATRDAIDEGIKAANYPGVAHAFYQSFINLKNQEGLLTLAISFDDIEVGKTVFQGCYDKNNQKFFAYKTPECNNPVGGSKEYSFDYLKRDEITGIVTFSFTLSDPELTGLGYEKRKTSLAGYYNDFSNESMRGWLWEFELYPNRILVSHGYEGLNIFTGKLSIYASREKKRLLYEGGLSFWRDIASENGN